MKLPDILPSWSDFQAFINHIADNFNPFGDVEFSDLYGWLPGDVASVCGILITILVTFFIIGIIKKVLFFL